MIPPMIHEIANSAHINEILLSLIISLLGTLLGLAAYFGNKYMRVTEENRDNLTKMAVNLEIVVRQATNQTAALSDHADRIKAIETRCNIFHDER